MPRGVPRQNSGGEPERISSLDGGKRRKKKERPPTPVEEEELEIAEEEAPPEEALPEVRPFRLIYKF